MKSIRCSLLPLMAVLALPFATAAQQPFEGSVTYRVQAMGQAMSMTHHVKGDDVRMDMEARGMQQRMGSMGAGADAGAGADVEIADLNITATGRRDRIAGHECEYYSFTASGTQVEICAAKGLGWYFAGGPGVPGGRGAGQPIPGVSNAQRAQWERMFADGFFPLKISMGNAGEIMMEVTELTRQKLDASMFQLPAGYTRMRIGG